MVAAITISAAASSSSASAIASHFLLATTSRCAVRQWQSSSSAAPARYHSDRSSTSTSRWSSGTPAAGPSRSSVRWASTSAAAAPATTTASSSTSSSSSASLAPHLTSVPDPRGRFDMPLRNMGTPSPSPSPSTSSSSSPPPPPPPQAVVAPSEPKSETAGKAAPQRASRFRAQKAPITLTPTAIVRLRALQTSPTDPKLIRISVKNKGCAGMSYHLEYVKPEEAGKFDERVKQEDVTVLIDSKALFSIIGSEMDWKEDRLSAKFVFNNPLAVSCGCGESFNIG
ncbi:unnamed protein product [Tilletia controversa]|uniref:Core domain-containing protein n=3 Tax=Tilletia TaxID=13289 RepID=A0A8X7MM30_9BASI|nr:hypothetical protein CF335_g7406 [Tilletia laevis]KAE8200732.1 hypothetical protein CF328_g2880 [Tilletia controversa]KAE8256470.1 hypothetical protein A4X03_0g5374 [Tilletia caries]KAE8195360.1 hypothetical protein CF336_g3120 [Tilletia laevis]KAE8241584.1 hypothetical protein A4X06_0g7483 [Tilletia controversa]